METNVRNALKLFSTRLIEYIENRGTAYYGYESAPLDVINAALRDIIEEINDEEREELGG